MSNTIVISGIIGLEVLPDDIREQLKAFNGEPVDIEINSPGGLVVDGIEIFNLIRMYKGKVKARIMGLAGSMASIIPMAADEVEVFDNSVFFIHLALSAIRGNKNMLRNEADILDGFDKMLIGALSRKSGKEVKELEALMEKETFFFGPGILDNGFADTMIESDNAVSEEDRTDLISNAKAQFYACKERIKDVDPKLDKVAAYLGMNQPDSLLTGNQTTQATFKSRIENPIKKEEQKMENFEKLVQDHVHHWKCKRTEAIKEMAKQHPEVHAQWIADYNQQVSTKRTSRQNTAVTSDFPALVEQHQAKTGLSKVDAMREVITANPQAHADYIAQMNA